VKYWVYGLSCYRLALLYEKQFKIESALRMYKECLPIYREMRAKEEGEVAEKIERLGKEMSEPVSP
jgi:hypothetical protein